ncbi:hypothetical protein [Streptomyces paromomycinus]|uniref:Uncharacterized protein n=1 Tax=Streptomyces paromomycinus TaxID=92743 RepID=A0A401VVR7_STREY|nr:hypothetical protein [Streptomyces paromomycinus]GCD41170.1 hypothetical protein GKJPGBOP_00823 [Streptomyces paromomycinus]
MTEEDREYAQQWLAERGVTRTAETWRDRRSPGEALTPQQVAHAWADEALSDSGLDAPARLRLAFGLLDLLGDYWVTCELRFAVRDERHPLRADLFWDACRRRLEAPEEPKTLVYSLWVDWFEDRATAAEAFTEVLVDAVEGAPDGTARDALLRRATRVLGVSGPVPWPVKHATYRSAATVPQLHPALFRGLLGSYHDLYGDLEPRAALALLDQLDLPAATEHLAPLRAVLTAGHQNHYRAPDAWPRALDASQVP